MCHVLIGILRPASTGWDNVDGFKHVKNVLPPNNVVFNPPVPQSQTILITISTVVQQLRRFRSTYSEELIVWSQQHQQHTQSCGPLFVFLIGQSLSRQYFTDQLHLQLRWCKLDTRYYTSRNFRICTATGSASLGASDDQIEALKRGCNKSCKRFIRIPTITSLHSCLYL